LKNHSSPNNASRYLIVIGGPTASGKTDLAIRLALHYQTEIISADARQFYRELNIGTAKPDDSQLKAVKHHFINNKSISELYGAGDFACEAKALLEQLFQKKKIVVAVGGSGLYLKALTEGFDPFPNAQPEVRETILLEFREKGIEWLQHEVARSDPHYYAVVDRNNPQRLMRALEVSRQSGKPYSGFLNKSKISDGIFTPVTIALNPDRQTLYDRINSRVEMMMQRGLLAEVRNLLPYRDFNAMKTVGYKEIVAFLDGKYKLEEAIEKIKQHTRNYAKRQITWFKNSSPYHLFSPGMESDIIRYIDTLMHGD
jgi:tRNA dimethylallyltransferase